MKSKIETIAAGASWEKTGNTSWVQCDPCKSWFPVGPSLLARPEVKLHCPHCHREFVAAESARVIKAG